MLTLILISITCTTSLIVINDGFLKLKFSFYPNRIYREKEYYRFITYGFIHINYPHLILNMCALGVFGSMVEEKFTIPFYILLYVGGLLFCVAITYVKYKNNSNYVVLGSSGGISSLVFSAILINPGMKLCMAIPAYIFGIVFLVIAWILSRNRDKLVAHEAHLFGSLFGFFLPILFYPHLFIDFIDRI